MQHIHTYTTYYSAYKGNSWQTKVRTVPMSNLGNWWVFFEVVMRSMCERLFTRSRPKQKAATKSPAAQSPQHSLQAACPADNPFSMRFSCPESSSRQLLTHFYTAGKGLSKVFQVSVFQTCEFLFPPRVSWTFLSVLEGMFQLGGKCHTTKRSYIEPCSRKYATRGGVWRFITLPHFQSSLVTSCRWKWDWLASCSYWLWPRLPHHDGL